jgi:hypothetical protein
MKKHVIFFLIPLCGLVLTVWSTSPAQAANNIATDICTSCTTAAQFQAYAQSNIPSGAYFWTSTGEKMEVPFAIFNPDDSLASEITAHGPCISTSDGAPCTWDISWDNLTGTSTEEQNAFSMLAPSTGIQIPSSVASTFTGTSQASAVSAWLNSYLTSQSSNPPLGFVLLTIFPDGSSAEYQVTGTSPLSFTFVLDSGHAANGDPENDSGEVVSPPQYTFVTSSAFFNLKQAVASIQRETAYDQAILGKAKGAGTNALESFLESNVQNYQDQPTEFSYWDNFPGSIP